MVVASFAALLYFGRVIYQVAPPIPDRVVTTDGQELFTRKDIHAGQDVWRSIGGHELGSIWGHGSYVAPDWTADWLHREALWILNYWAKQEGADKFEDLDPEKQAALQVRLQKEIRTNTYDPNSGTVTISGVRFQAIKEIQAYYVGLFRIDPKFDELRDHYAMPPGTVSTDERAQELTAFIFWASWSCITERPGHDITYTHNWPPDKLIGNEPTGSIIVVSVASFVILLAGIGALIWLFAATRDFWKNAEASPPADPIFDLEPTPAMRSTLKFFWLVGLLLVVQMAAGVVTAHYAVEGNALYGIPLAKWIPYSLSRTWHVQLGIFWIATSWLATGLCLAPTILGHDPKWQRAGTNVLFVALFIVVVGSMTGEALGIEQKLNNVVNFWFGHQGYEYVDLGRFWQILLLVGLFLWVLLMSRALWPAFRTSQGVNTPTLPLQSIGVGGWFIYG